MTGPKIGSQVISLSVAAIEVTDRIRPTSDVGVAALDFVIGEHGFTVPILVRKLRSGLNSP